MSEKSFWHTLKKHLDNDPSILYQRIEDTLSEGVPDVCIAINGVWGWYELKYLPAFPKRSATPVRLDYRKSQLVWAERSLAHNGIYGLVTKAGSLYTLHNNRSILRRISNETLIKTTFVLTADIVESTANDFVKHWIEWHIAQGRRPKLCHDLK